VAALEITSDAVETGGAILRRHTCDAENVSPPLSFAGPREETPSLALVVDDPEAARREGRSGFGTVGYAGPGPPPGHGHHRYSFRLHALDAELGLEPGPDPDELERALELAGGYER
jgi:phosphatidylethanolamine-binding protein (PEBP) family uncharacterized protein